MHRCTRVVFERTATSPGAVDDAQAVLEGARVVVERVDQLLLRRLTVLRLHLEVLLDIRALLTPEEPDQTTSLLEKAQQIRRLTKLRP